MVSLIDLHVLLDDVALKGLQGFLLAQMFFGFEILFAFSGIDSLAHTVDSLGVFGVVMVGFLLDDVGLGVVEGGYILRNWIRENFTLLEKDYSMRKVS